MKDKALIAKVLLQENKYTMEYELKELTNLCKSCDIDVIDVLTQTINKINPTTYLGSGKLLELKTLVDETDVSLVVFDDELSPTQLRNIEECLDVRVIDRSMLILEIFSKRAKTNDSILEVKLAQLQYLFPRLTKKSKELSRQGGFQSKGPGEKQIDLDKRKISEEILLIQNKLAQSRKNRFIKKQKRLDSNTPTIALVGYTNSGKSTTMNTLIKQTSKSEDKLVLAQDMLFATLDTSVRRIKLQNKLQFMLIDTVGFVSNLPHHLVNSFHSTLSDTLDADLIIHVVDSSNPHLNKQVAVTNNVLQSIGASHIKQVYLLNKADEKCDIPLVSNEDYIYFSNKTLENLDGLLSYITNFCLDNYYVPVELHIPMKESKLISYLEGYAITSIKLYTNELIYYKCYIESNKLDLFDDFRV